LISIILPTYNESENIVPLIADILCELNEHSIEIIVVDDNSPDGTYEAAAAFRDPRIRAFRRTQDKGLAKSVRCGLEKALGDVLVVMASDFNDRPQYLKFMIQSLSDFDCVSASRYLYGGGMGNRLRYILSGIFNQFTRFMIGGALTDYQYCFFAIKKRLLAQCDYDKIFWGFGDYKIRLFYYLLKMKARILEIPAQNGRRRAGRGNHRFIRLFFQYTISVLRLACQGRVNPWFRKSTDS
jgi:dolichol-phosphate mannosyltransferase